ncbi:DoxX family protein [Aquiflexum sp. LQ15W]|uniref:DoxX family protein n=1 Tax=Cognataquiflexum nitidum TaxID=2922272 RepID=UPI001F1317B4|nr:DoxX family protein [Cognataquiflexum nitidum]MCH6199531.1 DoxX family protein [Cognataquiflexum nitidum]
MKTIKIILLYILVAFYLFMGSMHFINPNQYFAMMPSWLPSPTLLIYLSGVVEIALAVLLIPVKTRPYSAKIIIVMLLVFFFAIHIPQSIDYYQIDHPDFVASMIRLPVQFLFIAWAWLFTKKSS